MSTFLIILKLLALVVPVVLNMVRNGQAQGQSMNSLLAQVLQRTLADLQKAKDAEGEADAAHKAHPNDDSGFDPGFRRD